MFYLIYMMNKEKDFRLIQIYILNCAKKRMTLEKMGQNVGRTKSWASALVNGRITRLQFCTRNRILEYLGEL